VEERVDYSQKEGLCRRLAVHLGLSGPEKVDHDQDHADYWRY